MPRFRYYTATTLNGFLADEDDSLDWLFAVARDGFDDDLPAFLAGIGAVVMGSVTYRWVLREEGMIEHPERWTAAFGDRPAFVFTSRDPPVPAGADIRTVAGAVTDRLAEVVAAAGDGDVWIVGGGDLAGQFADAGALDTLSLSIAPATLATGKPLLPRTIGPERLRLVSARENGAFARLEYELR